MTTEKNPKAGLGALLTPDNCALILIDHQPFQFAGLRSHDSQTIINNVVGLAKAAKVFAVPTLLTTVIESKGGLLLKQLQDVFPDQQPLDRTWINAWEDKNVIDWVKKTGKNKIVIAALWSEICLAMPAIQAAGEGYEVYVVTDASGGVSLEGHEMAIQRMIQAGVVPITWMVFGSELQRDWARTDSVPELAQSLIDHSGNVGTSLLWEWQLLATAPDATPKV
ncbi:hydrolase [Sphingobacterium sp. HMA12]|uniref:hydrolase n=1 Tax=Sphingobacterium sp. HMA12 TaxID=2050894 RepID=UPI000CE9B253|nr:hydrolase [Sphingobacterium sp. HMA12]